MNVVTWNVNSVRTRLDRVLAWLDANEPDVVCMQEIKCVDDQFPSAELSEVGYHAAVFGQKTYNGVAIVSKAVPADVTRGFEDGVEDAESRLIAATLHGFRIVNVYVPNGQTVESDKYLYKQKWLRRLVVYLERQIATGTPLIVCGDMNVAPEAIDVARVDEWEGTVIYNDEIIGVYREVLDVGLVDVFRRHCPEAGLYSWWDYRRLGFPMNNGLRIDHILATSLAAERSTGARIDRDERKGKKPSDHAPVVATFVPFD